MLRRNGKYFGKHERGRTTMRELCLFIHYIVYICTEDDAGSRSILEFGAKFGEMDGMRSFPSDGNIYGNIILNKIDSFSQNFTM